MNYKHLVKLQNQVSWRAEVEKRAAASRASFLKQIEDAESRIAVTLAHLLDVEKVSVTTLSKELNVSRDKVLSLAGRARKRTAENIRKGTN